MKEEDRERIEKVLELYRYRHELEESKLETVFMEYNSYDAEPSEYPIFVSM